MASFHKLVLLATLIVISVANKCLLNRQNSNSYINGEYVDSQLTNEGKTSYELILTGNSCPATLYMYYYNNGGGYNWLIGETHASSTFRARCSVDTATPELCGNNWEFPDNGSLVIDNIVSVTDGSCPIWNCDSVTVSGSANSGLCDGTFVTTGNVNEFALANPLSVWYWKSKINQWVCGMPVDTDCLSTSYSAVGASATWISLSTGNSIAMDTTIQSTTTSTTFQCVGTAQPTTTTTTTTTSTTSASNGVGTTTTDAATPTTSSASSGSATSTTSSGSGSESTKANFVIRSVPSICFELMIIILAYNVNIF